MVELISDLASTLRQADGKRVVIRVENTDEAVVLGEPELIKSLFRNLVDNALCYSPPEELVEMRIRLDGEQTQVEVVDQGPGISHDESLRIFDRFYRIDNTRTRETGGFGLGLAIVKAIATIHHADVQFRSDMAIGTAVCVKFRTVHRASI